MTHATLVETPRSSGEPSGNPLSRLLRRCRLLAAGHPPLKGFRAYTNWLRSNYELHTRSARVRARPLKLTIDPTNVCQLRCALCPTGMHIHDREAGHANLHLFERLLEEVGDYVFFIDFFNWGEPLLNTHVEDFIELARRKDIVCNMSTNLSLPLTADRIHRLVTCGLHEITVSLDGASPETYATYRRNGNFHLVCDNLRRLVAEKRRLRRTSPVITWQFLVFRFNEHEIDEATRLASGIGVDRIAFRPPFVEVDRYPLPDADKDPAQWTPVNQLFHIAPAHPAPLTNPTPCSWHYMASAINWDGGVAPCCTLYQKQDDFGSLGKSGERSYMDLLNDEAYTAIRDRFAGRRSEPTALVCERCPTPSIQNLHTYLNRQIVLFTLSALLRLVSQVK